MRETRQRIGEILVAEGLLTENVVSRALGFQRMSGDNIKLGSILLNWDLLGEEALLAALAKLHHSTAVPWATIAASNMEAVLLLPAAFAHRAGAIAYSAERGTVRVAFVNPSNIAVVDEAAAVSGRRVIAGVTTELRMMQAHHRFYGRHLPLEYRAIIQKLQRKTTGTPKAPLPPSALDFRAGDLVQAERDPRNWSPSPPSVSIPVEPGRSERPSDATALPADEVEIEVPEMPLIGGPAISATPETLPASSGLSVEPRAIADLPTEETASPMPDAAMSLEEPSVSGEDSLADWVGEALMSFHASPSGAAPDRPDADGELSDERSAAGPEILQSPPIPLSVVEPPEPPAEDSIAGMWQPAPPDDDENVASGMWTPNVSEPGEEIFEARSRDEIADTVLANALTDVPRVVLLGIGKTFITGWRGRGPGLTPDRVAGIRVPITGHSVFATVRDSGTPHFGPVEPDEWTPALRAVLGRIAPECAVFPIRVGDDVAAFLYADRFGEPMQYEDFGKIARAAASAAGVLARFLLRHDAPVR